MVHLLSPANLPTLEPATKLLPFSNPLTNLLERWLESLVKAAIPDRSPMRSPLSRSISNAEATECSTKRCPNMSPSGTRSFAVTSQVKTIYERAPILESEKRASEEHCGAQSLESHSTSPALHAQRSADTATNRDFAVPDKTGACMSNGTWTSGTLDRVPPPSVNVVFVAEKSLFELLAQILYNALYFDSSGSFRKCGSGQAELRPATSTSGQTPTTPRKRQLESDGDRESNHDGDENNGPGGTKRSKANNITSGQIQRRFACLHCKRNLAYGDEPNLMCAGWSTPSIDNLLRRHLEKHIAYGHVSRTKYDRVRSLMGEYSLTDAQQSRELWIAAYMEVFNIDLEDRHLVPSPYYDSATLARSPGLAAFATDLMDRISENPVVAIPLRTYIMDNAALDHERNAERERLRDVFRVRETQLIERNRARRDAAIHELDVEYDARQFALNLELELALGFRQTSESENHIMPREGAGPILGGINALSSVSGRESMDERRLLSSRLHPSSTAATLPMLLESNSEARSAWDLTTNVSLYDNNNPIVLPSMIDAEDEAVFDAVARQSSPSMVTANSHNPTLPADAIPAVGNDAIDGEEGAIPMGNGAGDVSSSLFGMSPDSGYASSYPACGCGRICPPGQDMCDSCADWWGKNDLPS